MWMSDGCNYKCAWSNEILWVSVKQTWYLRLWYFHQQLRLFACALPVELFECKSFRTRTLLFHVGPGRKESWSQLHHSMEIQIRNTFTTGVRSQWERDIESLQKYKEKTPTNLCFTLAFYMCFKIVSSVNINGFIFLFFFQFFMISPPLICLLGLWCKCSCGFLRGVYTISCTQFIHHSLLRYSKNSKRSLSGTAFCLSWSGSARPGASVCHQQHVPGVNAVVSPVFQNMSKSRNTNVSVCYHETGDSCWNNTTPYSPQVF